jgi:RNase P/RNase MRP subunit p29
LVKADFSGAKVTVIHSNFPGVEGITGIITRETSRTFVIITEQNEIKRLIKEATIF